MLELVSDYSVRGGLSDEVLLETIVPLVNHVRVIVTAEKVKRRAVDNLGLDGVDHGFREPVGAEVGHVCGRRSGACKAAADAKIVMGDAETNELLVSCDCLVELHLNADRAVVVGRYN